MTCTNHCCLPKRRFAIRICDHGATEPWTYWRRAVDKEEAERMGAQRAHMRGAKVVGVEEAE